MPSASRARHLQGHLWGLFNNGELARCLRNQPDLNSEKSHLQPRRWAGYDEAQTFPPNAESKTTIKTIMGVTFTFIHWRLSESHGWVKSAIHGRGFYWLLRDFPSVFLTPGTRWLAALEYKHRLTHSAFNRPEALWGWAAPAATPGTAGWTLVPMKSSREKKTEVREMTSVPRQMLEMDKVKKVPKSVRKVLGMGILWLADPAKPLPWWSSWTNEEERRVTKPISANEINPKNT